MLVYGGVGEGVGGGVGWGVRGVQTCVDLTPRPDPGKEIILVFSNLGFCLHLWPDHDT
jgi:hypothetical protein